MADIDKGRTYFDVAHFEIEAESLIRGSVDVILSGTPTGDKEDGGPLVETRVA